MVELIGQGSSVRRREGLPGRRRNDVSYDTKGGQIEVLREPTIQHLRGNLTSFLSAPSPLFDRAAGRRILRDVLCPAAFQAATESGAVNPVTREAGAKRG